MASIWTITEGVTQDLASWGVSTLKRSRKSPFTDQVTFLVDGANMDSSLPFAQWSAMTISRNELPWFQGIVTKISREGKGEEERLKYEVSGPGWHLEQITFQQQWVTVDPTGGAGATMTTTRSRVIIGQALNGVKMNLGQVMTEVLYYALYAYQGEPYPTTLAENNLPPAPSMTAGPFQIGALTPSIVIPYMELMDRSCAEIIKMLLRFCPDVTAWFDYSTSPPTLNIDSRANLPAKTIAVLDGSVEGFDPTPRSDLQVPVVVAKYEETYAVGGVKRYASSRWW